MKMLRYSMLCYLMLLTTMAYSQFLGGHNDGHGMAIFASGTNIYAGGNNDGYSKAQSATATNIYTGGSRDGHAKTISFSNINIFSGGDEDGYAVRTQISETSIFSGGTKDGHAISNKILDYIWNGSVNSDWLNPFNWNQDAAPRIRHDALILANVPNYPNITNGIFAIGKNPNNGLYTCANLWILESAFVTSKAPNAIKNYGLILIDGSLMVQNTSATLFENIGPNGRINIRSAGEVRIED